MVSNALDCLYGKVLKPDDIQLAFARLVGTVDDVALDNPEAYDLLSKFLVRLKNLSFSIQTDTPRCSCCTGDDPLRITFAT